jgi:hypothetical protein
MNFSLQMGRCGIANESDFTIFIYVGGAAPAVSIHEEFLLRRRGICDGGIL